MKKVPLILRHFVINFILIVLNMPGFGFGFLKKPKPKPVSIFEAETGTETGFRFRFRSFLKIRTSFGFGFGHFRKPKPEILKTISIKLITECLKINEIFLTLKVFSNLFSSYYTFVVTFRLDFNSCA